MRVDIGERRLQPGESLPHAATSEPQRLQRRRELQRELDVRVLQAPSERPCEIVHFEFGLLDTLLMASGRRSVEQRRHRRVVIAMTAPHLVGFAGFGELFERVLADRLEQVVSRCAARVVSDHERLVDEQAELVEDL